MFHLIIVIFVKYNILVAIANEKLKYYIKCIDYFWELITVNVNPISENF